MKIMGSHLLGGTFGNFTEMLKKLLKVMLKEREGGGWVFPNEGGFVFNSFQTYIRQQNGLNESLFALVIVGYSEGDGRN